MYRENNKGPRTVPWGTPDKTGAQSDFTPFTTTRCCLKHRNESIHFNVLPLIPQLNNLLLRSSWGGVSNAFSKSNMNVSTCHLLSKILAQSCITLCLFLNACSTARRPTTRIITTFYYTQPSTRLNTTVLLPTDYMYCSTTRKPTTRLNTPVLLPTDYCSTTHMSTTRLNTTVLLQCTHRSITTLNTTVLLPTCQRPDWILLFY